MSIRIFILILILGSLAACNGKQQMSENGKQQMSENGKQQMSENGKQQMSEGEGAFYNMGKKASETMAINAWENLGKDCQNVQSFVQIVEDSMDDVVADMNTKYQGQSAEDFGSGYLAGLLTVLNEVRNQCQSPSAANQLNQLEQVCREKL